MKPSMAGGRARRAMLRAMIPAAPSVLHVACLCAGWCRTCDSYRPVFEEAVAALRAGHPALRAHWIDIEDEAELVGDYDVETFPTLVVADAQAVRFAGPLTPQPETLQRLLRATLADAAPFVSDPAAIAFATRLRARGGGNCGPAAGAASIPKAGP